MVLCFTSDPATRQDPGDQVLAPGAHDRKGRGTSFAQKGVSVGDLGGSEVGRHFQDIVDSLPQAVALASTDLLVIAGLVRNDLKRDMGWAWEPAIKERSERGEKEEVFSIFVKLGL